MPGSTHVTVTSSELSRRLSELLSELGDTCLGIQTGIGEGLASAASDAGAIETLQEIDRVTQTLFCLSAFLDDVAKLDSAKDGMNIGPALSALPLRQVAASLSGTPAAPVAPADHSDSIELF